MIGLGATLVSQFGWVLYIFAVFLIFTGIKMLRLGVHGLRFSRYPWSVFDSLVVAVAFVPANEAYSVLRAARVLRILRLISVFPRLRRVVEGLIFANPSIGSIGAILMILFYVFAIMATKLFGEEYPVWFGSLHASLFSLFQIMTLEGWPHIVRQVMQTHPMAWIFFVIYILAATFTVLNLFIAVVVDAMQRQQQKEDQAEQDAIARIEAELAGLHQKMDVLRPQVKLIRFEQPGGASQIS